MQKKLFIILSNNNFTKSKKPSEYFPINIIQSFSM